MPVAEVNSGAIQHLSEVVIFPPGVRGLPPQDFENAATPQRKVRIAHRFMENYTLVIISASRLLFAYSRLLFRDSVPISGVIRRNSTIHRTCIDVQPLTFMRQSLTFQVQRATFLGISLTFHSQLDGFPRAIARQMRSVGRQWAKVAAIYLSRDQSPCSL